MQEEPLSASIDRALTCGQPTLISLLEAWSDYVLGLQVSEINHETTTKQLAGMLCLKQVTAFGR
jgi:hypothetical protein